MSIYIQIATLEDTSILNTVMTASVSADSDVHIGVAATVGDEFFSEFITPLTSIANVRVRQHDPATERGLGRGRVNSRFAYDGEDYIVQVDAHTLFRSGWDSYLIKAHDLAVQESSNDKTLMTGYLGRYNKVNGRSQEIDKWTGYPIYSVNDVAPNVNLKGVSPVSIKDFPDDQIHDKKMKFYPSNRVCGNFTMGNRHWAEFHGWTGEEVFWEEETTPAITLLNEGFSLVFPNLPLPITHRYWTDDRDRQFLDDVFEDTGDIVSLANAHIARFIEENREACDRYAEYCGYDIVTNSLMIDTVIPKTYEF